jgi:hypothetical protein
LICVPDDSAAGNQAVYRSTDPALVKTQTGREILLGQSFIVQQFIQDMALSSGSSISARCMLALLANILARIHAGEKRLKRLISQDTEIISMDIHQRNS